MVGLPNRQEAALASIAACLDRMSEVLGAVIVGSMAAGSADAASDLDLIVCAKSGRFGDLWQRRHQLQSAKALACWDDWPGASREITQHKWVTETMVLVEGLIASPASGLRLASPWRLIAGSPDVAASFTPRVPIARGELTREVHPVERAYDDFKTALRAAETTPDEVG